VDLKEKVERALEGYLHPDLIQLEDDDGISGFVVSEEFRGVSAFDRQTVIYKALRAPSAKISRTELRRVLGIAALTSVEYEAVCQKVSPPEGGSRDGGSH
jgi:acid stress-induced BolA-like protein IbaG/YrbA